MYTTETLYQMKLVGGSNLLSEGTEFLPCHNKYRFMFQRNLLNIVSKVLGCGVSSL